MPHRIHPIFSHDFITVTDLPVMAGPGAIAGYNFLPGDGAAMHEQQLAGVGLMHADRNLLFWKRLGHRVSSTRVARCHGSAAYAAKKLFDLGFHIAQGLNIWICGRGDHYFLVLSASPRVHAIAGQFTAAIFDPTDVVVDFWLYNVTRQQDGRVDNGDLAVTVPNYVFMQGYGDIRVFAQYV